VHDVMSGKKCQQLALAEARWRELPAWRSIPITPTWSVIDQGRFEVFAQGFQITLNCAWMALDTLRQCLD
jgi:hypothetical protein